MMINRRSPSFNTAASRGAESSTDGVVEENDDDWHTDEDKQSDQFGLPAKIVVAAPPAVPSIPSTVDPRYKAAYFHRRRKLEKIVFSLFFCHRIAVLNTAYEKQKLLTTSACSSLSGNVLHPTPWCLPSYTMVSSIVHHGVLHRTPWCLPSYTMVSSILHHGVFHPTPWCLPSYTMVSSINIKSLIVFEFEIMVEGLRLNVLASIAFEISIVVFY